MTFGMAMRYLGIALGYALALGLCAAFGTLVPPIFNGEMVEVATSTSGQFVLGGVLVCLIGIALSGKAGVQKERELSDEQKRDSVKEFNFVKGVLGHYYGGMLDVYSDMTQQAAVFGNHFEMIEMCELHELRESVSPMDVEAKTAQFQEVFDCSPECDPAEMKRAAKTSVARCSATPAKSSPLG